MEIFEPFKEHLFKFKNNSCFNLDLILRKIHESK